MCQSSVAFSTLLTIFFLLFPLIIQAKHENFARLPPGKLVFPPHTRSESEPQQVHISLVGKDGMRVSWVTEHKHTKSTVEYGTTPGKYNAAATGEHASYQYFFYKSGTIHHVTIGPLEPGTTYYYRCGGSGPEFSFRTPPSSFPVEFVVVGESSMTSLS